MDAHDYGCWSWSWDSRYVLLCSRGTNRLLRFSIVDGQIRELLALKTGALSVAQFSPDSRFVAYEVGPSGADHFSRIFVMPSEGGQEKLIYQEPQLSQSLNLLDWTADWRYVAVASERTGKSAL